MSPDEATEVLMKLSRGELTAADAQAELAAGGVHPVDAEEMVIITLGGSDIVG
ncbi:MAG: hypothetical protein ABSE62_15960 [Chthoniobacteraceae bacterium]|jgi:hypothetical protein